MEELREGLPAGSNQQPLSNCPSLLTHDLVSSQERVSLTVVALVATWNCSRVTFDPMRVTQEPPGTLPGKFCNYSQGPGLSETPISSETFFPGSGHFLLLQLLTLLL